MKKAVITLLALAGVAAADWTAEDANGWIYKSGSSWITHSARVTENETTKDLTIAFLNADGNTIDFSHGDNNRCRYTFALTLNLDTLTFPTSATAAAWGGNKVGFGLKEGGAVTACIGAGAASWNTTGLTLGNKGTLTLIVTTDEQGSLILAYGGAGTYTSTPANQTDPTNKGKVNGTTTAGGTYYGWTGLKEGADITSFTIDSSIAGSVEKFAVWNSDVATQGLTSTQMLKNMDSVASAMKSIPEPTTATLSLLALAGLAARRRRQ